MDELLDIVDENDKVIGQKYRSEIYAKNMNNYRAVNAFLINSKGQLWIPRRVATKKLFPLCLDASVAGHVGAGESYDHALEREAVEELNLNLTDVPWKQIGFCSPYNGGTSAFTRVYEIYSDATPNYNHDDFIEGYWLYPKEIMQKLAAGDKSKSDLPKLIKIFYANSL